MTKKLSLNDVPQLSSVQDMVLKSCTEYSNKIALEDLNETPLKSVTFKQLLNNILKFGTALRSMGIQERAHIALIGENRVQWAVSFLTAMCFNYVIVPIDKNLSSNEIYNIIHESDSEAIIFSGSFADMFTGSHGALRRLKNFICMDKTTADDEFLYMIDLINKSESINENDLPQIDPDELAEIIFTSGSLGRAKGVMLSQKNLASNLFDMLSMLMMYPEDRFLSVLPMHHTYECTCGMMCPLYAGSSVHYSRSLKTVVDDLQNVKATILLGVPLLYDKMFKRISKTIEEDKVKSVIVPALRKITNVTEKFGLSGMKKKVFKELHKKFGGHVRLFIAGGAAPDPLVAEGLRELGFGFIQGYGLTETSPILTLNRIDDFKDNAAGIPLPNVEIKINNPDSDGVGDIYAKGSNIMLGYYKNKELTTAAFDNEWFITGDVGLFDKEGFLHISGRKKNVIISRSGKNVFPEEIEDILNRSPFILESVVYGKKDAKHDEIISAHIVADAEAFIQLSEETETKITDDLISEVISKEVEKTNKQLTSYKRIVSFNIREEEFIKTTTQKIKRYLVKEE
jgi:long-chain acyl-CoA synthetase